MSNHLTRQEKMVKDIDELLSHYNGKTKTEILAAQRGLLTGWLARIASTDWVVAKELEERLESAKRTGSFLRRK